MKPVQTLFQSFLLLMCDLCCWPPAEAVLQLRWGAFKSVLTSWIKKEIRCKVKNWKLQCYCEGFNESCWVFFVVFLHLYNMREFGWERLFPHCDFKAPASCRCCNDSPTPPPNPLFSCPEQTGAHTNFSHCSHFVRCNQFCVIWPLWFPPHQPRLQWAPAAPGVAPSPAQGIQVSGFFR